MGSSETVVGEPDQDKPKDYALLVADTIIVTADSDPSPEKEKERITTQNCPKSWTEIAYFFKVILHVIAWDGDKEAPSKNF